MEFKKGFDFNSLSKRIVPVKIENDLSSFSDNQKKVIQSLIKVAKIIDDVYLLQRSEDNLKIRQKIEESKNQNLMNYFTIMKGPVDEFENSAFINGYQIGCHAEFYPHNLTIEEWDNYLNTHPQDKNDFISPHSVIRRRKNQLIAIPYSEYYKQHLQKASEFILKVIDDVENYYLKSYLTSIANAFGNNDYEEAEIRWLQLLDGELEVIFGPHEFYDDKFLGYKAAFTAFISIRNQEEYRKLKAVLKEIESMQQKLPIPAHYKKQKQVTANSKLMIVDLLYNAGEGRGYAQTVALNLPNSEKIRSKFGSKKVLFHNIIKAKFDHIMTKIADRLLSAADKEKVTFTA
ncbi:MAG: peptidase, partial [Spirochaetes bacterium]|nr:peptidase [Spirochaetota bacterium]